MKAIRIHNHGGPEVLKIDEIPILVCGPSDVLIKIKAAALNHLDIFVRQGIPGVPLPVIMGSDGAGEIEKCGRDVKKFKNGQKVVIMPFRISADDELFKQNKENLSVKYKIPGEHCDGVQAQYVVVDQAFVMNMPDNINFHEAAAFPLVSLTAYHMLVQKVDLKSGDWVLIHGASSGVGSAAIQIAKSIGAKIIASTSSEEKAKLAKTLGADHVINYQKQSIGKTAKEISNGGVDIVFEHTGEKTWKESLRALKIGGKLVTCGATTGPHVQIDLRALFIKQQQLIGSTMGTVKDMIAANELVRKGLLKPIVSKNFHFQEVRKAHEFLESGKQFGKVVLDF